MVHRNGVEVLLSTLVQGDQKAPFSFAKSKVKLATFVEGDQKVPFSIATTLRPLLLSLDCSTYTLDIYLILLSVKQESIKYHF